MDLDLCEVNIKSLQDSDDILTDPSSSLSQCQPNTVMTAANSAVHAVLMYVVLLLGKLSI